MKRRKMLGYSITEYSFTDQQLYYDIIYEAARQLFLRYNPCRINSKGECIANRIKGVAWSHDYKKDVTGCCHNGCKYITNTGCSTKSLGCKLYYCTLIMDNYPELVEEIQILKHMANEYDLPWNVYKNKEEGFNHGLPTYKRGEIINVI